MNIYQEFKPTYLYIKQHTITGKLYFGKSEVSSEKQLLEYNGSGVYWKKHIKKHGKHLVITLWYCLFYEEHDLTEFAAMFSMQNNIGMGDTSHWANLMPENGFQGGATHHNSPSDEHKQHLSTRMKNTVVVKDKHGNKFRVHNTDLRYTSGELVGVAKNLIQSDEHRSKNSKANSGENHHFYGKRGEGIGSFGKTWKCTPESNLKKSIRNKDIVCAFNLITHEMTRIPKEIFDLNKNTLYVGHRHTICKNFLAANCT